LLRRAAGFISGGNDKDAALTVRRALQLEPESIQGARLMAEIAEAAVQSRSLVLLSRVTSEWGWMDEASALLWSLTKFADIQLEALHTLYRYYSEKRDTQGLYRVFVRLADRSLRACRTISAKSGFS
jgi:hypothetical protein